MICRVITYYLIIVMLHDLLGMNSENRQGLHGDPGHSQGMVCMNRKHQDSQQSDETRNLMKFAGGMVTPKNIQSSSSPATCQETIASKSGAVLPTSECPGPIFAEKPRQN